LHGTHEGEGLSIWDRKGAPRVTSDRPPLPGGGENLLKAEGGSRVSTHLAFSARRRGDSQLQGEKKNDLSLGAARGDQLRGEREKASAYSVERGEGERTLYRGQKHSIPKETKSYTPTLYHAEKKKGT